MDSKKWLKRVGGGASVNSMAKSIDMTTSTLDSQIKSPTGLKPETMVALARQFGYSPVAALVDRGLITTLDARQSADIERDLTVPQALAQATDDQLLKEIGRRLDEREGGATVKSMPRRSSPATPRAKASRKDKDPDA